MLCGPATLIPKDIEKLGVNISYDIDEVMDWADAINVLRIQMERMGVELFPSTREYRSLFGITHERLERHDKKLVIMHPGPINRGVEIDSNVADSSQAIILGQVLNGVASRMAILYLLLGGKQEPV
jgi:aspartate carbamoyltransferase catalytic subunit